MKQMTRERKLTPEEAAKYKAMRQQIAAEKPELIERHLQRMEVVEQLLIELKAAREAKGLSLADVTNLTGMDASALSKLETLQRPNPTMETVIRYAAAVGKQLTFSLSDAGLPRACAAQ